MKFAIALPLILSIFLITGCENPIPDKEANFCDVEEQRRFDLEEIAVRAERWPENLIRDYQTNATWDRECSKGPAR